MHFVQSVDVEVLRSVDMTVVTCVVGLPPEGVVMLVIGQGLVVVWILQAGLALNFGLLMDGG